MAVAAVAPLIIAPAVGIVGTTMTWAAFAATAFQVAAVGYSVYQQQAQARALERAYSTQNDDQGLQTVIRQPIPQQRIILGAGTVSGALFFSKATEDTKPYIYYGLLLAAHECDSLEAIYLNNNKIVLDDQGFATAPPYNNGATKFVQASFRNGHIDQEIDPILAADFPDLPNTFRQGGHCTVVIKAHFGTGKDAEEKREKNKKLYGEQGFNPIFRIRGHKIFDPRDPTQILEDKTTYKWSDNASLAITHLLKIKRPETGARINWDRVAEAADLDDQWLITKKGKAIRKHTVNGVVNDGEDLFDVMGSLLTANSGSMIVDNGQIYPMPSHRKKPVGTLHMNMIKGGFSYSPKKAFKDLQNIVHFEFPSIERDNKRIVGPIKRDAHAIAKVGIERPTTMVLSFTELHERAQFIAARILKKNALQRSFGVAVNLEAEGWRAGEVINIYLTGDYARINGLYELASTVWDEEMEGFQLQFIEYDPDVENWNAQTEEQDFEITEEAF